MSLSTGMAPALLSRENLLRIARALPADLSVLSKLGTMLQDENSDLDDIAALLRRDVALAARMVRIGNSPAYGAGGSVASVEEAVNRVGFGEVLKLVGAAAVSRFTERGLDLYCIEGKALRNNMLYTALATESLAHAAGIDPRLAYTAGLLRSLGLMVLDQASRGPAGLTQRYTTDNWLSYSGWEGSTLGINNCEVAALILGEWGFSEEMSGAIRSHYLPHAGDAQSRLATLLNLANGLACRVNYGLAGELTWWNITPEKLTAAGLTLDDLESAFVRTKTAFEAATAALAA